MVAAALVARAGYRVTLVDSRMRTGTGALLVTEPGLQVLSELGVEEEVRQLQGAHGWAGLTVRGSAHEARLEKDWRMVSAPRGPALDLLEKRAVSFGVTVIGGFTASVPVWERRRVSGVRCRDRDGREYELGARVVVDATGPESFLPTVLGQLLPRRVGPRCRFSGTCHGSPERGPSLSGDGGNWVLACPGEEAVLTGVTACPVSPEVVRLEAGSVAERLLGCRVQLDSTSVVARRVGGVHRTVAGEGWVAVGEAAGCGAPGLPGVTAGGLLLAASAAWEIDLALQKKDRAFSGGSVGATVAMARQRVYLETLAERVLGRVLRVGMLDEAVRTSRRRAVLTDILQGNWADPRGRFSRLYYLWSLDRKSRRLVNPHHS